MFKISRLCASKLYIICSYFKSLRFFGQPFWSNCEVISRKLLINSQNQNIFQKFKLNRNLQRILFKLMYNMSMLRHRFSNERWGGGGGGGGGGWTTFLSYSVKVCRFQKKMYDTSVYYYTCIYIVYIYIYIYRCIIHIYILCRWLYRSRYL